MALIKPTSLDGHGSKTFASVALSTNVDGVTGADVMDMGAGLSLYAIELSASSTDSNYTFKASADSTASLRTVLDTTGNVLTVGATAANVTSGNIITVDSNKFAGHRYLQVMSGTPTAPIANAIGATAKLYMRNPRV
jgi:hypothetical protein